MRSITTRPARWTLSALAVTVAVAIGSRIVPLLATPQPLDTTNQVVYAPSSESFANPERGFFHAYAPFFLGTERAPLTATILRNFRNEGVSLVRANYVFDEFRQSPLSQSALGEMTSDFSAVRAAGLKIIPRVMYSFPCAGSLEPCGPANFGPTDTALPIVLNHIASLTPVLQANADVIAYLEMGFVGAWGEWHNSTNNLADGNYGIVNANSAAIVAAVLGALPSRRAAVIRTPHQKQALFGPAPLTAAEAFTGTPRARVGAHNDCLLANDSGGNTYVNPYTGRTEAESYRQYLSQDNLYVPQGGETCSSAPEAQPYIQCPVALGELTRLRWSALNTDYQPIVLSLWQSQGCYAEIAQRLGYRFRLIGGEFPARAFVGGPIALRLSVANDGWAAPYNPRSFELVLRNLATNAVHVLPANVDPRFWTPGMTNTVNTTVTLPATVPPGSYQLLLNLPDPEPTLHDRPEYSIRLANAGVWEAGTGYNNLQATVTIENATPPAAVVLAPPVVAGAAVTLRWSGGEPGGEYVLEAGSAPGSANLHNASIGNLTSLTAIVPSGTYYVRIRARNSGLLGPASNEVSFTVGGNTCTSPPQAPNGVSGRVSGGVATVTWNAVPGATSYTVQAGPSPGSASFFDGDVGAATAVSSPVAPGFRGYVRVSATNACGRGPVSLEIVVE